MSLQDDISFADTFDVNASEVAIKNKAKDLIRERMMRAKEIRQSNINAEAVKPTPIRRSSPETSRSSQSDIISYFTQRYGTSGMMDTLVQLITNSNNESEIEASFTSIDFGYLDDAQFLAEILVSSENKSLSRDFAEFIAKKFENNHFPKVNPFLTYDTFHRIKERLSRDTTFLPSQESTITYSVDIPSGRNRISNRRIVYADDTNEYQSKTKNQTFDFFDIGIRVRDATEVKLKEVPALRTQLMEGAAGVVIRKKMRFSFTQSNIRIDMTRVTDVNGNVKYEVEVEIIDITEARLSVQQTAENFLRIVNLIRSIINSNDDITLIPSETEKAYARFRLGRCFFGDKISTSSLPFVQNKPVNLKLTHFYTANLPPKNSKSSILDDGMSNLQIASSSSSSSSNAIISKAAIDNALVTVKVDGNRAFLIALDSGLYLCEGYSNVFKIGTSAVGHPEYLLDTEIVRKNSRLTIFVFDVLCSSILVQAQRGAQEAPVTLSQKDSFIGIGNYTDYRNDTLLNRLAFLGCLQIENRPFDESGGYLVHISRDKIVKVSGIEIYAKQYFYGNDRASVYDRVASAMSHIDPLYNFYFFYVNGKKVKYEQDGLIFQNADTFYMNSNTFKWKPREKVTIDFLVKRISGQKFNLCVLNSDSKDIIHFDRLPEITFASSTVQLNDGQMVDISELDGKVVEFAFNNSNQPVPYRIREDKAGNPNRKNVALDNYNDVLRPILIETLLGKDTVIMRKVHNRVKDGELKRNLIEKKNLADIGLADIGSGRGADLDKWGHLVLAEKLDKVLCIEPDEDNRAELLRRSRKVIFSGKNVFTLTDQEAASFRGKTMLENIEIFEGGAEQTEDLRELFEVLSIDNVASFFSLTFFFQSEDVLNGLINTLRLLPVGGKFFGIVLDGQRVRTLLGGNDKFECDSFNIAKKYESASHGAFGLKIVTSITDGASMVKNVQEYLVDFDLLVKRLAHFGFKLHHSEFLEGKFEVPKNEVPPPVPVREIQTDVKYVNMPHNSLVFSSLNRAFCFVRESHEEVVANLLKDQPTKVVYSCKNVVVKENVAKELVEKIDETKKEKEQEEKIQKDRAAILGTTLVDDDVASSSQDFTPSNPPPKPKAPKKAVTTKRMPAARGGKQSRVAVRKVQNNPNERQ